TSRSARARASASAWSGFADERMCVTSAPLPASSTTLPCCTATACTRWRASTTPPLVTDTLIGSTRSERLPEFPEMEALRRALDGPGAGSPTARAGPAHIATRKTTAPPLRALEGRRLAGADRRGKRLLLPTDDNELVLMIHLMSAGRVRYLRAGEAGPKTPA